MSQLRIFSYLPNPRIWKATIAARLAGVEVEVRGGSPRELQSWLWDFDARPLSPSEQVACNEVRGQIGFKGALHKTEAFLDAHPFGTVPAAFSPDGAVGIFESNSIMRAVARLGESRFPLYGGVRAADRVVNEVAPELFDSEDMRAGVAGVLKHGARNFRDKVVFQGR
jgi:elongation factor 1-gamma